MKTRKVKTAASAAKARPTRKAGKAAANPKAKACGVQKKFLKTRPVCKVTFTLPRAAAPDAESVYVTGEFNDWSRDATPLKRRKNGDFFVCLDLEKGRSYRFRYLIDGWKFENDWQADRYEPNPYGGDDSVIEL